MRRNEVVERMAKKLCEIVSGELHYGGSWEKGLRPKDREKHRKQALELTGIVEENCEERNFPTLDGVDVFIVANDELRDAFQLARKAREGRENR